MKFDRNIRIQVVTVDMGATKEVVETVAESKEQVFAL
jgi:hypothetical protein